VIDVKKAQRDPAHSVTRRVAAGCSPVRMALAPDGATAWVTARNSNAVLGFSVPKLLAGDAGALLVTLPAGVAPVPVLVTPDGGVVLAGNSNRFGLGAKGNQTLSTFDVREAVRGRSVPLGQIKVGRFPRELTRTKSGLLVFLSNWDSDGIMVFDAARLVRAAREAVH
jgi:DNA-binding beta-propeller fold protein YncE